MPGSTSKVTLIGDVSTVGNSEKPCPDCVILPGKCPACKGNLIFIGFWMYHPFPIFFGDWPRCLNCNELGDCPTCRGSGSIPS